MILNSQIEIQEASENITEHKVVRTVGVRSESLPGEKDYRIFLDNGTDHLAVRKGQKFFCDGFTGTLKEVKEMLCNNDDAEDGPEAEDGFDPTIEGTWDCVQPCALLIRLVDFSKLEGEERDELFRTLDAYGWIEHDEIGDKADTSRASRDWSRKTDVASADREWKRFRAR